MNINSVDDYNIFIEKEKRKIKLYRISILCIFLVLWELFAYFNIIDVFLFSSPSRILETMCKTILNGELIKNTSVTFIETIIAFLLSTILGILTGLFLWYFDNIKKIIDPYLVLFNSIPKTAIAPMIIVWFGIGYTAIIIVAISLGIFATTMSYISALNDIDEDKIKLIYVLGGDKSDVMKKVVIPYSVPYIIAICKVNIGLSLIGVIIGEFLVAQKGLGYMIIYGSQIFDLDSVILSLSILSLISYMFYAVIEHLENKFVKNSIF